MKRMVRASKLDTFLKYHDDESNYYNNENGFNKMYKILEKYDDSNGNDTVDIPFLKATPEDQDKMIELITPAPKFGTPGYAKVMYRTAAAKGYEDRDYNIGIVDAFDALFAEGILNRDDFDEED